MAWLEHERPDVYGAILEADRTSRAARGHGNAIAQAYGHAILPLCSRRDKVTQVRWGLADFRHRFGREAARDVAPRDRRGPRDARGAGGGGRALHAPRAGPGRRRARARRRLAAREPALDPRRAYRWEGGEGRDAGALLLRRSDLPRRRLRRAPPLGRCAGDTPPGRLRRGRVAPAARPDRDRRRDLRPSPSLRGDGAGGGLRPDRGRAAPRRSTNHAAFLAAHPPTLEARVVDGSSWSCAHGVERWRGRLRVPGRAPPRLDAALAGPLARGARLAARRRGPALRGPGGRAAQGSLGRARRLRGGAPRPEPRVRGRPSSSATRSARWTPTDRVQALRCLELQRHRLLMYTSCGWFFDEISGIETVQVLRYAARVLPAGAGSRRRRRDSRRSSFGASAAAPSNVPELRDGAGVWRRHVAPSVTDLARVAAHYAIAGPIGGLRGSGRDPRVPGRAAPVGSGGGRARRRSRSAACG